MKHLKYLSYIVRHKWFVLCACWSRGLYWQGIVHDWSKFLPSEWLPYAEYFYGPRYTVDDRRRALAVCSAIFPSEEEIRRRFDVAWLKHLHRSPHHWQHWVLREDSGLTKPLEMPRRYAVEMVCDWKGAGRVMNGKSDNTVSWYFRHKSDMSLHPATQKLVERELGFDVA